jgi:hypothetical protein
MKYSQNEFLRHQNTPSMPWDSQKIHCANPAFSFSFISLSLHYKQLYFTNSLLYKIVQSHYLQIDSSQVHSFISVWESDISVTKYFS